MLPPHIQVCPVQLPGRENRLSEHPLDRLEHIVENSVRPLGPFLDLPFAFFGHSMGALVAFALAHELRAAGRPGPGLLAVAAYRAPHLAPLNPPIHQLPDAVFLDELSRRYDGIPATIAENPELRQLFLPLLKADVAVIETYSHTAVAPLDCPISAFGGLHDPQVGHVDLDAWRIHTTLGFKLRMLSGRHFFLNRSRGPLLHALSADIAEWIAC
jgi:surfactin synthase thioesterase subunit